MQPTLLGYVDIRASPSELKKLQSMAPKYLPVLGEGCLQSHTCVRKLNILNLFNNKNTILAITVNTE